MSADFSASKRGAAADEFAEGFALLFQAAERVENRELFRRMQQRLVIVRAVHVHQPFADGGQRVQRGGRAVDELAVRAAGGERALEDELVVLARFQAVLFEKMLSSRFSGRREQAEA